jgi:hypothetical protein
MWYLFYRRGTYGHNLDLAGEVGVAVLRKVASCEVTS